MNEEGIHLLRNRFNYSSIPYKSVQIASIKKGREYKYWLLMLIAGIIILALSLFYASILLSFFHLELGNGFYIESELFTLFPAIGGASLLALSFRKTIGLEIQTVEKKYWFSLKKFTKDYTLQRFHQYLKTHLPELKHR